MLRTDVMSVKWYLSVMLGMLRYATNQDLETVRVALEDEIRMRDKCHLCEVCGRK